MLVTGKNKADIIKRVLGGETALPASLVNPQDGELIFLLDREASSKISLSDANAYSHEDEAILLHI